MDLLMDGYEIYKDNDKIHKRNAAEKKKEKQKKHSHNEKKLNFEHLDYIKAYLDEKRNKDTVTIKYIQEKVSSIF